MGEGGRRPGEGSVADRTAPLRSEVARYNYFAREKVHSFSPVKFLWQDSIRSNHQERQGHQEGGLDGAGRDGPGDCTAIKAHRDCGPRFAEARATRLVAPLN